MVLLLFTDTGRFGYPWFGSVSFSILLKAHPQKLLSMHWCKKVLPFIAVVIRDTESWVSTPSASKPVNILSIISSISYYTC